MELSREEYWSGMPLPTPGDLPNLAIKPTSLTPPAGGFFTTSTTWEAYTYKFRYIYIYIYTHTQIHTYIYIHTHIYIQIHIYHIFTHSSADGHVCCFHVLAIINTAAAVNTEVHIFSN